jgi:hypothetical protein
LVKAQGIVVIDDVIGSKKSTEFVSNDSDLAIKNLVDRGLVTSIFLSKRISKFNCVRDLRKKIAILSKKF